MSLNRLKELAGIVTVNEARSDMNGLIDKFLDVNKLHNFEGPSGLSKFEKLLKALDPNYRSISDFLEDNPGAYEALMQWITKSNVKEWIENLKHQVPQEEEEDD